MLKGVIVGTGRSGTTLLVNLLGSHPRLSPLYELEFVTDIIHWFRQSGQVQAKEVLGLLYGWGSARNGLPFREVWDRAYDKKKPRFGSKYALFTKTELMTAGTVFLDQLKDLPAEKALAGMVNTLVNTHCRNDGKPWCVLKVPALIRAPEIFATGFPGVKFVHIIRDGRDVWCSARNHWWGPKTVPDCAKWWAENVRVADLIHNQFPGMMLEVKYESLLEQPQAMLDKIFRFLGLEPAAIDYEITMSSVGRHLDEMSAEEIDTFNKIAGPYLESRDYAFHCERVLRENSRPAQRTG